MLENTITLFSSDSRPQYIKDIFNVLALPHGGTYRFRYKEKYIHSDIIEHLGSSKIKGTIALIAFRINMDIDENKHFFIPVRWVSIKNVKKSSDFYASITRNGLSKIFKPGVIREGGRTNINIEYNNFCDISDSEINIEYDECLLIPSGDKRTKIECRYDSAVFAFQAKGVLSKTPTQITLNCCSYQDTETNQDIETKIKIPLIIKRNHFYLLARVILSLLGAIGIGLPGILPDTTPSKCTVTLFVLGSLLIAFNWLIPYKE